MTQDQRIENKALAITASKHNLHRRVNSFCKIFGRQFFSFLQKQQTLVSLNKHSADTVSNCKLCLLAIRYSQCLKGQ